MTIAEKIKYRRTSAGLSVADASEKANATRQQWEQWESGYRVPGYGSLLRIAEACGVTVAALVVEPEAATPEPVEVA